jgi:LPS-assembly protein
LNIEYSPEYSLKIFANNVQKKFQNHQKYIYILQINLQIVRFFFFSHHSHSQAYKLGGLIQKNPLPMHGYLHLTKSDLLGQISARPRTDWTVDSQAQYTPSNSKWQNVSLLNRFNPKPASMLSAAYRYVRGSSNTIDVAFQWPVARHWYAVGRYQHAMRNLGGGATNQNSGLVEALAGFEYDGGCWVGRVVAQQYVTSATEKNTALFFQIELNGMGRVGTNPLSVLTRSIPNYQLINQITPLPSKFDNFQ